ncbi:MAG: RNA polymerase sigma factor RpoD/SigA [Bacteroidales bacterium]|nr:RNA polymerase sigma factor RpoD/SigA [Bacteroidales bacterium]
MTELKITQSVTERTMSVENYLKDISALGMISPEQELELAQRIQQGDEKAVDELVMANLRFVVSVAKQYHSPGLELSDLINEGNIGLIKAARRFDPTRGFKFISFAVWWVRQQIMAAISDSGRMVRLPANQIVALSKLNKAKSEFLQDNGRDPSTEELAQITETEVEKILLMEENAGNHLSFDRTLDEDSESTLIDVIPDTDNFVADDSMRSESLRTDIAMVLNLLPPREKDIILSAFGIGCHQMSLEEIGEKYDLTKERVRQIKERAIRKLTIPSVKKVLAAYV